MLGKRLIKSGAEAATSGANTFASENFNTVLYTGNGATQRIGGYINRGAVFNGSNSYIYRSASGFPTGNNSRSISLWVDNKNTINAGIIGYGNTSTAQAFYLYLNSQGKLGVYGYYYNYDSNYTLPTNQWVHLVITHDGTTTRVYANGTEQFNLARTFNTGTNYFRIGGVHWNNSSEFFNGKIDQVRIFDKALSTSEITTLNAETFASTTISNTDIFDDNSAIALYQLDGNANDTGGASGKYGAAAHFNGSSSYIQVGNPIPNTDTDVAISAWVNLNSGISSNMHITGSGITTAGSEAPFRATLQYQSANTFRIFSLRQVSGTYYLSPNSSLTNVTINPNTWYHIVWSYTASGRLLNTFLNGVQIDTNVSMTTSGSSVNDDSTIIGSFRTNQAFFSGKIDQLRMYSSTLDSSDATNLYNESSVPTTNLIAHYKFNGDARDETVPSYDGAATNVTYAYDGTASNVTYQEATKFTPDLVWIKKRSSSTNSDHVLQDSVRGISGSGGAFILYPNLTNAEDVSDTNYFTSFNSNGFSLGSSTYYNGSGETYVAWCWKAADTTTTIAANSVGNTIASNVRANTDAGFSIGIYTGNNTAGATIGHGLNSTPELVIVKLRSGLSPKAWTVYAEPLGNTKFLYLNSSNAAGTYNFWNNTSPTSSVISLSSDTNVNSSSGNYVFYAFHSVDGYSKIGSYTGTGTSNGNFVETGFEPAFVMVKRTDGGAQNWVMFDNKRSTTNPRTKKLAANLSSDENNSGTIGTDAQDNLDFYADGFRPVTSNNHTNISGGTFIYLAIAADPDTTTPTVENSFDVVTYSGTGAAQDIETDFKPDLAWIKSRSHSTSHELHDSVRGEFSRISSDLTSAASTSANGFVSLTDNGFSLDGAGGGGEVNASGRDYVAWVWKAADHDDNLPQINTEGSIDSVVSVNAEAGFSIVKYTGNLTASTVGHGLSSAPELIILKRTDSTSNWFVYSSSTGNTKYLNLDSASAATTFNVWNNTSPTSIAFSLAAQGDVNASGGAYIAYCFHSVTGYQKIGSYSGTGTTSNFTGFGFQPRFIMIKRTDSSGNWWIFDSTRGNNKGIRANLSGTEDTVDADANTYEFRINFISDGFQYEIDNSTSPNPDLNVSGATHIYMAFK